MIASANADGVTLSLRRRKRPQLARGLRFVERARGPGALLHRVVTRPCLHHLKEAFLAGGLSWSGQTAMSEFRGRPYGLGQEILSKFVAPLHGAIGRSRATLTAGTAPRSCSTAGTARRRQPPTQMEPSGDDVISEDAERLSQAPLVSTIPVSDLSDGVRLALEKSRQHLSAAKAVLDAGLTVMAAAHFYQGVEEFGKAKLLEDAFEAHGSVPAANRGDAFLNHRKKFALAKAIVPEPCLLLSTGGFQIGAFQSTGFDIGTFIDPLKREQVLYLNRTPDGLQWQHDPRVSAEALAASIDCVRELVEKAQTGWQP